MPKAAIPDTGISTEVRFTYQFSTPTEQEFKAQLSQERRIWSLVNEAKEIMEGGTVKIKDARYPLDAIDRQYFVHAYLVRIKELLPEIDTFLKQHFF